MFSRPLALITRARVASPLLRAAPQLSLPHRFSSSSPYSELKGFPKDTAPEVTLDSLSSQSFGVEIKEKLSAPINSDDIEVKPDGQIYLPEIKYRRILNEAIGPGAWVLVPRSPPIITSKLVTREYSLYCFGKFVSQATGEQPLHGNAMTEATAIEATKSNALMRCCKDLGIASELWDPNFILRWKSEFSQTVWCENVKTKEKRLFHRKINRPSFEYPWKETSLGPKTPSLQFLDSPDDLSVDDSDLSSSSSSSSSSEGGERGERGERGIPAAAMRAASRKAEAAAASASSSSSSAVFSPQNLVHHHLKKYSGKTWENVLQDKDGPKYIEWFVNNFKTNDPNFFKLLQAALEYHRSNSSAPEA